MGGRVEYQIQSGHPEKLSTACLVVGVLEPQQLSPSAQRIDEASGGFLTKLLCQGDLAGRAGQILFLHNIPGILAKRVLLVGVGKEQELGDTQYREAITKAINALADTGATEAVITLAELPVGGRDIVGRVRMAVETVENAIYRFDRLKSKKKTPPCTLCSVGWSLPDGDLTAAEQALREASAISAGVHLAKDLANLPGNFCTPTYLAEQAKALVDANLGQPLTLEVLEREDMERLGMGALLAVAQGSSQPPKFIVLHYHGGQAGDKPIVLVGKGITFDSGGISIKSGDKMDEMKFDMSGAAAVLGSVKASVALALAVNLVGIIPATENLPDGNAIKPGDIVTSLSGQTIEILNTDAEGRLILCDALTYAERFEPIVTIDIATLTGACVVALGKHPSGLFANHPPLARDLLDAGRTSGDRVWELPLWEDYQDQLKSNFADMANVGGREGGAITAACFLARYTKKLHWAHLDIAGTAWLGGDKKGATGRPVPLLVQYLIDRCAHGTSK
ncbi:aminopeptidase A/I [Gammaproteobacteria bacterium]